MQVWTLAVPAFLRTLSSCSLCLHLRCRIVWQAPYHLRHITRQRFCCASYGSAQILLGKSGKGCLLISPVCSLLLSHVPGRNRHPQETQAYLHLSSSCH